MTNTDVVLDDSDRALITELVDRAGTAQSDTAALMDLHTDTTVVVNAPGRRVLGRAELERAMREALSGPLRDVETRVEVVDIRAVTADVALVSCIKTIDDRREDAAPLPFSCGTLTYVVRRADAGWRIALAQTTPTLT